MILSLARERDCLKVVNDQRGCPTAAKDIAQACLGIAHRVGLDPANAPHGTFHFAGGGEATWFEFAQAIVGLAERRLGRRPEFVPIGTDEYPTPACRPADSRLDCSAIAHTYGIALTPWEQSLEKTIDEYFLNESTT